MLGLSSVVLALGFLGSNPLYGCRAGPFIVAPDLFPENSWREGLPHSNKTRYRCTSYSCPWTWSKISKALVHGRCMGPDDDARDDALRSAPHRPGRHSPKRQVLRRPLETAVRSATLYTRKRQSSPLIAEEESLVSMASASSSRAQSPASPSGRCRVTGALRTPLPAREASQDVPSPRRKSSGDARLARVASRGRSLQGGRLPREEEPHEAICFGGVSIFMRGFLP